MQVKRGFAYINETKIYYETSGSGLPIVFIHGFALDTRMWDDQFGFFAKHYRVVRYDLRGFGKSALPTNNAYSHSDDLNALLTFLNIDRACIIGLSRGGRWAIQFALDYKNRVEALVIADAMPNGFDRTDERPSLSNNIISSAINEGIDAAKEAWFNHPIFEYAKKKPVLKNRLCQMISDYSGWHWYNEDIVKSTEPAAALRLSEINVPTLIIVGEYDINDFKRAADYIKQNVSNSQKVEITGVGHLSNMESPTRFNEIILHFLQNVAS